MRAVRLALRLLEVLAKVAIGGVVFLALLRILPDLIIACLALLACGTVFTAIMVVPAWLYRRFIGDPIRRRDMEEGRVKPLKVGRIVNGRMLD